MNEVRGRIRGRIAREIDAARWGVTLPATEATRWGAPQLTGAAVPTESGAPTRDRAGALEVKASKTTPRNTLNVERSRGHNGAIRCGSIKCGWQGICETNCNTTVGN